MTRQLSCGVTKRPQSWSAAWLAATALLLLPLAAFGQQTQDNNAASAQSSDNSGTGETSTLQEVIVTGTLLQQQAAPVGSELISVDQSQLNATGGNTVIEQLQTLPQVPNIGVSEASRSGTGGSTNIVYGNSINIRGLSPFATLTLLDGHRVPPAGTSGATVDPDSFPSIMLQRVDVEADGASAIYGSDAVAGVANLILRRDVEGIEARVRGGWADGYNDRSLGVLVGHNWGSGQISLGYEDDYHSDLNGQDRSYFESDQSNRGGTDYDTNSCNPGTIVAGGTTYAIPKGGVTPATAGSLVAGTQNLCDSAKYADILPEEEHNDVALTFDQRLGDNVSLYGDATYAQRTFVQQTGQSAAPEEVPTTNAYFVQPPGAALTPCSPAPGSPDCEQVNYWFGPDLGPRGRSEGLSQNYQGTLGVNIHLGRGWLLNLDGTAGRDHDTSVSYGGLNNGGLAAALGSPSPATALNLFGGANSPAVLNSVFNSIFYAPGYAGQQVAEAKLNGALFKLPGGDANAAIGGQWERDDLVYGINQGAPGQQLVIRQNLGRTSEGAYGELLFPFVEAVNASPGMQKLELDIAGRFEHYSDVGDTTNPKIGINYSPVEHVTFRGTYGTSFRAPLLSELVGPLKGVFVQNYSDPLSPTGTSVGYTLGGGNLNLQPEKAQTWTLGVDFTPPHGHIGLDFFDIDYKDQVSSYLADLTILQQTAQLGSLVTRCPSAACTALIDQYVTGTGPNPTPEPLFGPPLANPSVFVNGLELNLGRTRTTGVDLDSMFHLPAPVGTWSLGLVGTLFTEFDERFTPTGPTFNELNTIGFPLQLRLRGTVGWGAGPWNLTAFANYENAYLNTEITPAQRVSPFTTLDLNFVFDVGVATSSRWAKDFFVTLNALNVFDNDPPYVDIPIGANGGGGFDPEAGDPIGRLVSLQLQKRL